MSSISALKRDIEEIAAIVSNSGIVHAKADGNVISFPQKSSSYVPSKTGEVFHNDDSFIKAIVGPVGSGKTTACCMEIIRQTINMVKCSDGIRRSRWAIIRNTYPDLKTTTLETWKDWFLGLGNSSIKMDSPISYFARFNAPDGICELHVLFLALDRDDDVRKLQSLELSGAYINEARYIPEIVLNMLMQRVGRYPRRDILSGSYSPKIILDTNPCDTDFWFYKRFEELRPDGHFIVKQPPGLIKTDTGYVQNEEADNIDHLPEGYYTKAANGVTQAEIDVQLMGKYGSFVSGDPVFASYNDDVHAKDSLEFTPGLPVYIGWDYGLTPAAVFCQLSPRGQLQVIKEFCSKDMFLEAFLEQSVKPFINTYLGGYEIISIGDPAGNIRKDTDGKTCEKILEDAGIKTRSALSNLLTPRLGAVDKLLTRMNGGSPSIVVSKIGAPTIRKGFQGKYCYKVLGGEKKPDKNESSHPMDALQYVALEVVGIDKKPSATSYPTSFISDGWC